MGIIKCAISNRNIDYFGPEQFGPRRLRVNQDEVNTSV